LGLKNATVAVAFGMSNMHHQTLAEFKKSLPLEKTQEKGRVERKDGRQGNGGLVLGVQWTTDGPDCSNQPIPQMNDVTGYRLKVEGAHVISLLFVFVVVLLTSLQCLRICRLSECYVELAHTFVCYCC